MASAGRYGYRHSALDTRAGPPRTGRPKGTDEMNRSRTTLPALVLLSALLSGSRAAALPVELKDQNGTSYFINTQVDTITCEEFLALNPNDQNRIAYWVDGYQAAKGEAAVGTVAFDKFGQPIGALVEDCKATPKETLWQKLKKHL